MGTKGFRSLPELLEGKSTMNKAHSGRVSSPICWTKGWCRAVWAFSEFSSQSLAEIPLACILMTWELLIFRSLLRLDQSRGNCWPTASIFESYMLHLSGSVLNISWASLAFLSWTINLTQSISNQNASCGYKVTVYGNWLHIRVDN